MEGPVALKLTVLSTVLIILSDVIGQGVLGCPSSCLCYVDEGGLRTANCSGVNFLSENKYNNVFHEIGVLNIETDHDEPIRLWDNMFISFTKLKFLNLQNCRITHLPKNVFKGLKKVFEINLASNDIRHFDNGVFENIYALNKLNLRGNHLQGSNKPFISCNSLRELDLGYCGLSNLQNEFFHGVKKLTRLYLDGNHLQTVKEHILPNRITHLNLANNRIINVPITTINSLSQLRWLDLGANPINCTCALLNLQDILSGHATIIDGDLICAYPLELENISLSKVNENEVCSKETFNSGYHFKKSQTKSYLKKQYYFENEKYNPFEIQGDDPGTSVEDYRDENENAYDEDKATDAKDEKETVDDESNTKANPETKPENLVQIEDQNTEKEHQKNESSNKNLLPDVVSSEKQNVDEDGDAETKEKASHDDFDNANKKDSEPKPATLSEGAFIDKKNENNNNETEDEENRKMTSNDDYENKVTASWNHPLEGASVSKENENNNNAEDDNIADGADSDKETTHLPVSEEDVPHDTNNDKSTDILDESMKSDQVIPFNESPHGEHIDDSEKNKINESNTNNDVIESRHESDHNRIVPDIIIPANKTEENVTNEKKANTGDLTEMEGSGVGSEELTTPNASIPLIHEDEVPEHFTPDAPEEPIHKIELYPVENDEKPTDETENSEQVVDKKPINYEEMGPIIVVACIIVFITILVFIALYKGLCKSKETNRKPVNDVEATNGTELQDITSSLLPKTPNNDEKHNNKYINEIPSPETVNLIKADKTNGIIEQNHTHDLNQNDNKNEPIDKNGKTLEGSPPPIEKTTTKLTVLHESIPRTPIFVQKIPATVNNI